MARLGFILSIFVCSIVNAQGLKNQEIKSYTKPDMQSLELASNALDKCEILAQVSNSINNDAPSPHSSWLIFDKLQKTDEQGNLLIDNVACRDSILEFVSSLCSSDVYENKLYCNRLGITSLGNEYDYKQFGASVFAKLDIHNRDGIFSSEEEDDEKIKFSVASSLFLLTPVRGLKLLKPASRVLRNGVKPVLNGAMLVLATLGLTSCDDIVEPNSEDMTVASSQANTLLTAHKVLHVA